ncbi:MAG: polysaccharide biosynthesis tyrosine autokinase [Halioglobus sp.]
MNPFNQPGQPGLPPLQQSMDEGAIDLKRLLVAVMRYRWGILGLAFVIALATGLVMYSMQPIYRASASIVLESQQANVVNVEEVYAVDTYDWNYNYTQFEILKSRSLAERVVRRLELHKHPAFSPKEPEQEASWYSIDLRALLPAREKVPPIQLTEQEQEELAIQRLTGAIAGGLKVSPVEQSYVVYLQYESIDPKLAAQIVNALAEEFISGNLEVRMSGTLQATDWLSERVEYLEQNLRQSEQALQDFRDQEGLVDIEGVTGLGGNELRTLSLRLQEASKARIEAQNIMEDVQGMTQASTDELMTIPAVLQHQGISEIKRDQSAAERRVAELSKRYGVRHPKMIAAQSDLSAANEDLALEVRKIVSGISREYEVALRNEQQLRTNWEARKNDMQNFNRVEFRLRELQRDVDTNRQLYDIFFTRIKGVSETGGFEKPHARIIDRAMTPGGPVRPNKGRGISVAFILGILLGCGVAILLDILDNTIKSPDDVQSKLNAPFLGALPKQTLDKSGEFEQFWQNHQSDYAEAVRSVRTGVVLSGLDDPARIIVVTSTVPGEGKSTTALNLGAALAQMESTLVIGADLRRPRLAKMCGLAPNHQGLSHFVSGVAELEDCIEHMEDLGLHVMPAGLVPPNPLEMISSKRFVDALQSLKARFDRIVIDSAPVQAVSDALILASYADSVIYVVKADATSAIHAEKGIASMLASNQPLTGVVLNQFDASKARSYYGGQYYQYGDYHDPQEGSGNG